MAHPFCKCPFSILVRATGLFTIGGCLLPGLLVHQNCQLNLIILWIALAVTLSFLSWGLTISVHIFSILLHL
jgi:hypothetical protein